MRTSSPLLYAAALLCLTVSVGCSDENGDSNSSQATNTSVTNTASTTATTTAANTNTSVASTTSAMTTGNTTATTNATSTATSTGTAPPVPLSESVTEPALKTHLTALSEIALANNNTRVSSTKGFDASLTYVEGVLKGAGLAPYYSDTFKFPYSSQQAPGQTTIATLSYTMGLPPAMDKVFVPFDYASPEDVEETDADYVEFQQSRPGDVAAQLEAVDLNFDDPGASSSGCETEDFDGFTPGRIALIQRGACQFIDKIANAQAAGAAGVILFNQGTPDRSKLIPAAILGANPLLPASDSPDHGLTIPVVFARYDVGVELSGLPEAAKVRLMTNTVYKIEESKNLYVDIGPNVTPDSEILVVGAHLDSVEAGPGLNDNGSGSALILLLAQALGSRDPAGVKRTIRFAWWGAEEFGLHGSEHFIEEAQQNGTLENVVANLNVDMIASPNHVHFVLDSLTTYLTKVTPGMPDEEVVPHPGSASIESFLNSVFTALALPFEKYDLDLYDYYLSDQESFAAVEIPVGGVFSGSYFKKSADQVATYGGQADVPYDACYHRVCDTLSNVNYTAALPLGKVFAQSVEYYGVEGSPIEAAAPASLPLTAGPKPSREDHTGHGCNHSARGR